MAKETVESLCQKAQQAVSQGKNEHARQFFLQALSLRPDVPNIHYGLATVCFLLNDLASAAHHFREVTRLDPLKAGAYINLGAVYNRLDMLDEAIPVLRRGIQIDLTRAEGYYNLGLVYRRKGQPDLAIQAYREATRVNPRMVDAHYNLANLYYEKQNLEQAVSHYKQALELRPNWEKAQLGLEAAQAARHERDQPEEPIAAAGASRKLEEPPTELDPERTIDPQKHANFLNALHKATVDSEEDSRNFLACLDKDIEPVLKALSTALLQPSQSGMGLDQCVQRIETVLTMVLTSQKDLQRNLERLRENGDKLLAN